MPSIVDKHVKCVQGIKFVRPRKHKNWKKMIAGLKPVLLGKSAWATVLTTMTIKPLYVY